MDTYKIIRFYEKDYPSETMAEGLTLKEAKAHCQDPETSSRTATCVGHKGAWFDGFEKE